MGEKFRFEQSPREKLEDKIQELKACLRKPHSTSAGEILSEIENLLSEAKQQENPESLKEIEETIARLQSEVHRKATNQVLDEMSSQTKKIEEGTEKQDKKIG